MDIDQERYELIKERLDAIIVTNEKQWELIRKLQGYWTITFFLGKLVAGIGSLALAIWAAVHNLWHK